MFGLVQIRAYDCACDLGKQWAGLNEMLLSGRSVWFQATRNQIPGCKDDNAWNSG